MTFTRVVVFSLYLMTSAVAATAATAATLLVPSQYATIQSAVTAAVAGDEIVVSAGTYEEQVIITKDITLTGAGVGQTILLAPVFMPHTVYTLQYNAVIHVQQPATVVTLRDFTVEGAGRGREGTRFIGIMYDRTGGTAERINIINLHETPVSTAISGIGLYSNSESNDGLNLIVSDLTISNFQKTGFACFGDGCLQDIRNTVVDATNLYSDAVQNGFELLNGSSGSLTNCTARLIWYDGDPIAGTTAVGFLFYYAKAWTIDGSLADQCQSGLYSIGTNVAAQDVAVIGHPLLLNFNYGVVAWGLAGGLFNSIPASASFSKASRFAEPRPMIITESPLLSEFGKTATLNNCTVTGDKIAGSVGLVGFSGLDEIALTVENSTVAGWEVGILTAESGSGWVSGWARSCRIMDNPAAGIWAATLRSFDARGNFWGDPTGPYHSTTNPTGDGDEVVDNVVYDPWLEGNLICGPVPQYIAQADADGNGYSREVVVRYLGGDAESIYGFSIELTWNQANLTATEGDVSRPDYGLFKTAVVFQAMPINGGLRVDGALGGGQSGIAAGALFKVRFHLVGEMDYLEIPITVNVLNLRDHQNQEVLDYIADDGLVVGDVQAPAVANLMLANSSLAHTDEFAKNGDLVSVDAIVLDGDPLFGQTDVVGNFIYLLGSPGWLLIADAYTLGEFSWFERSASLFPADGPVAYSITATDPAGNTVTTGSEITADNTPPQTVTGLVAAGGHNQVTLQWNDPTGLDSNLRQVVIRANQTEDYPFYGAPDPGYPVDPTDGKDIYAGLGTGFTESYPADGSVRDVVYFQAFAVDQVDLFSAAGVDSRDRTTNYILADVTGRAGAVYDGLVDIFDVSLLGDTFGLPPEDPNFNAECDVGPTDDGTTDGIPEPNGDIDFDDLMIFSIAFERDLNPGLPGPVIAQGTGPDLVWRQSGAHVWVLELSAPCAVLKGLRLQANLPAGQTTTVTAGALLTSQTAPYFLYATPDGLDVSFALLGAGVGIVGDGELLRIETSQSLANLFVRWDARALDNTPLLVHEALPTPKSLLPSAFALHGNYPNPFNPETTIVFDLPSRQSVQVVIYGLDGRRVAQLVTEPLPAGRQQLTWRGRDDQGRIVAAGLYLYRLLAGPWSATGKMNLVK